MNVTPEIERQVAAPRPARATHKRVTAVAAVRAVSRASLQAWLGELHRSMGISRRGVLAVGVFLLLLLAGCYVAAGFLLTELVGAASIPAAGAKAFVTSSLQGAAILGWMFGLLALVLSPPRTALSEVLAVLEMPRWTRRISVEAPLVAGAGILALAVSGPMLMLVVALLGDAPFGAVAIAFVLAVVGGTLWSVAMSHALEAAAVHLLRLPVVVARSLTAVALLGVGIAAAVLSASTAMNLGTLLESGGGWAAFLVDAPLPAIALLAVAAVAVTAVPVLVVAGVGRLQVPAESSHVRVGTRLPGFGLVSLELKQYLRAPLVVSAIILVLAALTGLAIGSQHSELITAGLIAPLAILLAADVALPAYGVTARSHWISRVVRAGRIPWLPAKLMAVGVLWAALVAVPLTLAVLVADATPAQLASSLLSSLTLFAWMLTVGTWFPIGTEQALSNAATVVTALFTATILTVLFADGGLTSALPAAVSVGLELATLVGGFAAFAAAAVRRERIGTAL